MLIFVASCSAHETKNCSFSEDFISEKQYSDNSAIAIYQWFPKKNEVKGVLSDGNLFSVKHWSCSHYGKQAIMVLGPQIEPIPNQLNNHVVQLGKVALSEIEFKQLTSAMKNVQFNLSDSPMILRVASEEFDEFYAQINVSGEVILIEIKLYKS
jgi:hypothetical protein